MTSYKPMGTTDDVTTCGICGKPELKGTVILGILDADGNVEEVVYAGTTCAARRVGGGATAKLIRNVSDNADYRRRQIVENSRNMVAYYEPHEQNPPKLANAYYVANRGYFQNFPDRDPLVMARDCLARHREIIATDGISAL